MIVMFLTLIGPWNVFHVSEMSQSTRLKNILQSAGILSNGKVVNEFQWKDAQALLSFADTICPNKDKLSDSLLLEVYSILNYLDDYHGFSTIHEVFSQNIDSLIFIAGQKNHYLDETRIYMYSLGLCNPFPYKIDTGTPRRYFFNYYEYSHTFSIEPYQVMAEISYYFDKEDTLSFLLPADKKMNVYGIDSTFLYFIFDLKDTIRIDLSGKARKLLNKHKNSNDYDFSFQSAEERTVVQKAKGYEIKLILDKLSFYAKNENLQYISFIKGAVLIKFPKERRNIKQEIL
jgi:hypothetical protein